MIKRTIRVVLLAALLMGCSTTPNAPQAAAPSSAPAAATPKPRVAATVAVKSELVSPSTKAEGAPSSPQPTPAPSVSDAPTPSATQAAASGGEHTIAISNPTVDATITSGVQLDAPSFVQDLTLPLHLALRVRPSQTELVARLVYSNGVVLEQRVTVVAGGDGVGDGVLNLQWNTESAPPTAEAGAASLQIVQADGTILTKATVNMLPPARRSR